MARIGGGSEASLELDCSAPRLALVRERAMPYSRRLRAARFSAALWLPLAFLGSSAQAQPRDTGPVEPALRMTWESDDPACGGDDVSARALRMVSPGVVPRPLRARVEVRREGAEWLVRLQTESGEQSGRRILRADSCAELEHAIALLLAMTMESKGDVLPPETPAAPVQPAEPAIVPPLVTPPSVAPPELKPEIHDAATPDAGAGESGGIDLGWFARLDGKAATGLQPGLGLGVGVSAGVRLGAVDVGATGAFWPETRAQVLDRVGRVSVTRQNIGLRACWNAWRAGGLVVAPCLAPELTFFRYVSQDVIDTRHGTAGPLPSLTVAADLRYELIDRRLSVLLSPGLTWEKPQPFRIRLADEPTSEGETAEIYKTKGLGARLEVGVDARF
jgi:hypothetical protein